MKNEQLILEALVFVLTHEIITITREAGESCQASVEGNRLLDAVYKALDDLTKRPR